MAFNTTVVTRSGIRTVGNQNKNSYEKSRGTLSHASDVLSSGYVADSIGISLKNNNTLIFRLASTRCARQLENLKTSWKVCKTLDCYPDRRTVAAPVVLQPNVWHSCRAASVSTTSSNIFYHSSMQMALISAA